MRRSLVLELMARGLFHPIILVSLYVAFRGHNAPGGGFAGGLIAAAAFLLRWLAGGWPELRRGLAAEPQLLVAGGLVVSICTGLGALVAGDPYLTSYIWKLDVPSIGEVKLVSSALFDIGVYFVVLGVVLTVATALGADAPEGPETEGEVAR